MTHEHTPTPTRPNPPANFAGMAHHEIAQIRQTVAMLQPGSPSNVTREEVLRLVAEVQRLQGDLRGLTMGLRNLLDQAPSAQ